MKRLRSIAATLLSTAICSVAVAQESTKGDVEEALALLEAKSDAVCFPYAAGTLENGDAKDNYAFTRDSEPFRVNFADRITRETVATVKVLGQATIFFSELFKGPTQDDNVYAFVNLEKKTYTFSKVAILSNGQGHRLYQYDFRCLFLDEKPN
jgi:hypothetical protein